MAVEKMRTRVCKEEKLETIGRSLEELKNELGALTEDMEMDPGCSDEMIDLLTDAMEALDDAIDDVDDVKSGLAES